MRKRLFLTTAIVSLSFATNVALAENITERQVIDSGDEENFDQATADGINSPDMDGGVIKNNGTVTVNNSDFTNNSARYGGVIYNSSILNIGYSVFENNNSLDMISGLSKGGAIYNKNGKMTISNSDFINNFITGSQDYSKGGAIYKENGEMTILNSIFMSNFIEGSEDAAFGAAIYNENGKMTISNSIFENNFITGDVVLAHGGAINNDKGEMIISDSVFMDNSVTGDINFARGGAIYKENGEMTISNSVFMDNSITGDISFAYGGAVNNVKDKITVSNSTFKNNFITGDIGFVRGGAINNEDGEMTVSNSVFMDNSITGEAGFARGGAINNENGEMTISNSVFMDNSITGDINLAYGGAVSNENGEMTISNSVFKNNSVTGDVHFAYGGAISNENAGTINLTGDIVLSGNKINDELNDIYNEGTINISGNLSLDGGISGKNPSNRGKVNFAEGTNLTVKGSVTTIVNNEVTNQGATLHMVFENKYSGKYILITDTSVLDNEFTIADNALYNISLTETKGTYDINKKSAEEIAAQTVASSNEAKVIDAVTNGSGGGNASFKDIAEKINTLMQSGEAEVKSALRASETLAPSTDPLLQQTQMAITNQVFNAVGSRFSSNIAVADCDIMKGKSAGDVFEGGAMWVQGAMNHAKLDSSSQGNGFKSDTYGLSFGLEKKIDDDLTAGIGYAYNKINVDAKVRDVDVNAHTALIYAEYQPNNFFVNGIASYSWSDYEEKKTVLGTPVKAQYDVESLGVELMTGYDMPTEYLTVTPEIGMRYLHIKQNKYTDSIGQTVFENESDFLTGLIGAKIGKTLDVSDMKLKPEAKFMMTYDIKYDDVASSVSLPNGYGYTVKGKALERFGIETGVGLTADVNDNIEMSVIYQVKFRKDYQDHSGLLNFKYRF